MVPKVLMVLMGLFFLLDPLVLLDLLFPLVRLVLCFHLDLLVLLVLHIRYLLYHP